MKEVTVELVISGYLGMGGKALSAVKSEECEGKDVLST